MISFDPIIVAKKPVYLEQAVLIMQTVVLELGVQIETVPASALSHLVSESCLRIFVEGDGAEREAVISLPVRHLLDKKGIPLPVEVDGLPKQRLVFELALSSEVICEVTAHIIGIDPPLWN